MLKIYAGGTYDCFHHGHVRLFKYLKNMDKDSFVIAAVNGDHFTTTYKGRRPILNEQERCEIVGACKYVDLAFIINDFKDQRRYIEAIMPRFIAHGTDWRGDSLLNQLSIDKDFLTENGIQMVYPDSTPGISTTEIINRFIEREE